MSFYPPFGRDVRFEKIVREGNYYYPAWTHYREGANVICDRCARTQLQASIGFGNEDLCLSCAEKISNQMRFGAGPFGGVSHLDQVGGSGQKPTRPDMMTLMMPSSHFPKVEDDDDLCTFMEIGGHFPKPFNPPRPGFATRMAVSSAFPPRSRGLTTNMEVSQSTPSKNSS